MSLLFCKHFDASLMVGLKGVIGSSGAHPLWSLLDSGGAQSPSATPELARMATSCHRKVALRTATGNPHPLEVHCVL